MVDIATAVIGPGGPLRRTGKRPLHVLSHLLVAAAIASCSRSGQEVVVYVSHDRVLSEPILRGFEAETGIRVRAVYDVEANKTVGLTNRLLAESAAPRADLFWNNEVVQTIRLQVRGVAANEPLQVPLPEQPQAADSSRRWIGFAARARVLLLNTQLAPTFAGGSSSGALGLWSLASPEWHGRAATANPHFGTTGTHFAALLTAWGEPEFRRWLRALRNNDIAVLPGNAQVRESVASGRYALGLTDTDDAVEALADGAPVQIIFPDQGRDPGTLLIPNTVALVTHPPHAQLAVRLAAYLLSADVEEALARGRGAQIPLNHHVKPPAHLPPVQEIRTMRVDFAQVAGNYERMLSIVEQEWPVRAAQTAD
jgi:iron(III) transport system substrate-binding protein